MTMYSEVSNPCFLPSMYLRTGTNEALLHNCKRTQIFKKHSLKFFLSNIMNFEIINFVDDKVMLQSHRKQTEIWICYLYALMASVISWYVVSNGIIQMQTVYIICDHDNLVKEIKIISSVLNCDSKQWATKIIQKINTCSYFVNSASKPSLHLVQWPLYFTIRPSTP